MAFALEKGARGYITKNDDPNTILHAIDKVRSGSIYLGQAVAQTLAMINVAPANDPLHELNDRERQIVKLLGDGKSLTEISVQLALGYKTVANAVTVIKQKLAIVTTPGFYQVRRGAEIKHCDSQDGDVVAARTIRLSGAATRRGFPSKRPVAKAAIIDFAVDVARINLGADFSGANLKNAHLFARKMRNANSTALIFPGRASPPI